MHHVSRFVDSRLATAPKYADHADGLTRAPLINRELGSVHMDFDICELAAGGSIEQAVHAFEKAVYLVSGAVELEREGQPLRLGAGEFALVSTGTTHAWRNQGDAPVRWIEMCAPQPKPASGWQDTFFLGSGDWVGQVAAPDFGDPRTRGVGHDDGNMPPSAFIHGDLNGFAMKYLVNADFGGVHFNMFIIEFADGGLCNHHDHPFEEAYFVLDGAVDIRFDGEGYTLEAGDFAWTGVGAQHVFFPAEGRPVRWLEVQAPQPPAQGSMRWYAQWEHLRDKLTS